MTSAYYDTGEDVALTDTSSTQTNKQGIAGRLRSISRFSISRPIFSQAKFDDNNESLEYNVPATPWVKLKRKLGRKVYTAFHSRTDCSRLLKKKLTRTFPLFSWLPRYNLRQDLAKDLVAGITVGIMNIPQGMAYGKLSGVPHVYGLYTSFFPLLMYTLMGTSRHVSVGTFALISLMSSKIVKMFEEQEANSLLAVGTPGNWTQDAEGHPENIPARVAVLVTVTFCVGLWQMALGLLGLGSLTVYLSDQLVKGFTCGASFHVFTSQLKPVFGLKNLTSHYGPLKLIWTYRDFFEHIHLTHVPTLTISLICIGCLLIVKYLINENKKIISYIKFPVPMELLIVIFGALTSHLMNLPTAYGVTTVRRIPKGMPPPQVPDMMLVPDIIFECLPIAVVGFTITVSLGKLFAQKFKYEIEPNQEMKALGATNLFGSFFQCIPATGSLARSAVQVAVGGATQLVSVIAAMFVLVVLLALSPFLEPLPEACLGAIIMVALINLMKQVTEAGKLWQISLIDTSIFLVSLLAVVFLDVDSGLGVGVGYSLLTVILRTQRPEVGLLGRVPQTDIYKRVDSYKSAMEIPGVKIVRLDAPFYFANAEYVRRVTFEYCNLQSIFKSESRPNSPAPSAVPSSATQYHSLSPTPWTDQEVDPTAESSSDSGTTVSPANFQRRQSPETRLGLSHSPDRIHHLIFDCGAVCYLDVTGAEMIEKMALECRAVGVELLLASCKASIRETLFLSGFNKRVGTDQLYLTVHDAVLFATKRSSKRSLQPLEELSFDI
ncbi:Sulfate transporter [Hypsibius exemplaris]|uniref:Sulfate transporter n=1 Tax=Hypsibius exemplaris TaxID=2072580 RepID=A0A1W0WPG4_HYPEX|nr:Sulfate transporter [Hypsibius exemplaris]